MTDYNNILNGWDRIMAAITFSEVGEPGTARVIMETNKENNKEIVPTIKFRTDKRPRVTLRI
jgi:hypothetical protein